MRPIKLALSLLALAFACVQASAVEGGFGADRHLKAGLKCESCHGPDKKIESPEKEQCMKCHDPRQLAEKTKNVKPANPHNSPHYHKDLECTLCHLQHEKPENYCDQCHKFGFKVP